ncbi:alkene reductase [Kitasatospora sp. NBC_01287]|uniref:oxidoreductase n=1 Tax=Kitasatospora sp. NBC_01287 TaxID=2903573 RepID=UPI00224FC1E8|nr:alkene reductase [Kitasatospora sp. NBC_01287]MCX4745628.1 alkene reductase [Kitasatospora sp. NBC_01287]
MNPAPTLHSPLAAGALALSNRVVMAPMTRNRADAEGVPTALMAQYYAQRASAGLIITEGARISAVGAGPVGQPGLHSAAQLVGWSRVTAAVHRAGGLIVAQLAHHGRIAHPDLLPSGVRPVGPSAVRAQSDARTTPTRLVPTVTPRVLTRADIAETLDDYAAAAESALRAGFDGVEIQGANGYLVHQFLSDNANQRLDSYGGSAENRIRFALAAVRAAAAVVGADRVGLRLSPGSGANDLLELDPAHTYGLLAESLRGTRHAYLHVVEGPDPKLTRLLRERWSGPLIVSPFTGGEPTDPATATVRLRTGEADAVSFARLFAANPDLPERIRQGRRLAAPDPETFHTGGATGYTHLPVGSTHLAPKDSTDHE